MECSNGNHWLCLNEGEEDLVVIVAEKLHIGQEYSTVSKVAVHEMFKT